MVISAPSMKVGDVRASKKTDGSKFTAQAGDPTGTGLGSPGYFINKETTGTPFARGGDGKAAVGYGLAFNFLGLELHWDFARRYDLKNTIGKTRTTFWIGETF